MDFDFAPELDSLDKVPAQFKGAYGKAEGAEKYTLLDSHKPFAEAILGLNTALKAERVTNKKRPVVDLTPLAEFGDDPAKIAEAVKGKITGLEEQLASGSKVNIEKIRAEFVEAHKGEVTKWQNRTKGLEGQLYQLLVDQAATSAIAEAKGVPKLLLPFIRTQVKVEEADGKANVYVVDAAGDRRYSGVTGQPMSIKELVAEMKGQEEYGRLFDAEAPSGGGKDPESSKKPPVARDNLSATDKIAQGLKTLRRK